MRLFLALFTSFTFFSCSSDKKENPSKSNVNVDFNECDSLLKRKIDDESILGYWLAQEPKNENTILNITKVNGALYLTKCERNKQNETLDFYIKNNSNDGYAWFGFDISPQHTHFRQTWLCSNSDTYLFISGYPSDRWNKFKKEKNANFSCIPDKLPQN